MNHLITRKIDHELELLFQSTQGNQPYVKYRFARIGLGMVWIEDRYYACAVGERVFWSEDRKTTSRIYVGLEESFTQDPSSFLSSCISLKDRYLATLGWCPSEPVDFTNRLTRTEGLVYYDKERSPLSCERTWPTFVSASTRLSITAQPVPSREECLATLHLLMNAEVAHPDTHKILYDARLLVPYDLPMDRMRTALEQATSPYIEALWFVVSGLSKSRPPRKPRDDEKEEPKHAWNPNSITGY